VNAADVVLAVSLELAAAKWKVALHDGRRDSPSIHTVAQTDPAARLQAVLTLIATQRQAWSLPDDARVVVSYEAGQDAFWICRAMQARGIECYVVDPESIPVERHRRRAKTDRLDVTKLVINLRAWLRGERDRMRVVHVPSPQDEASRHLMRDRGELQKEVLQHRDRMRKLLATLGCWEDVNSRKFATRLARREVRCHDDMTALLWVHGVSTALNPRLRYFQGKRRIPAPLVIRRHAGTTDLMTLAEEVLGFSKMNFNSFDLYGQLPATIETSRRVAGIGALLDRFADRSYDYRLFM
jgi:hypothetical protein